MVLLVGIASMAQAQSLQWNGGTADWSSANWVNNPTYGSGGSYGAYWNSQATVINNGGTVNITAGVNNGDASSTGYGWGGFLYVGGSDFIGGSGGSGYVNMSGGTLSCPAALHEVLGVASGSGIFTQSGGVNVKYAAVSNTSGGPGSYSSLDLGYANGGYGEYNLQGGAPRRERH